MLGKGIKKINQRRFDLKNNLVSPGQNSKVTVVKIPVVKTPVVSQVSIVNPVQSTRSQNKKRVLLTPFSQKEFRETVIFFNKKMFSVSDDSSGNPSTYQYGIMNSLQGLITNSTNVTRLGIPTQENKVVMIAFEYLSTKHLD